MKKKNNFLALNKKLMKAGKLYKHTKKYNDWYFKHYKNEKNYLFFLHGESFKSIEIEKDAILMFVRLDVVPTFADTLGINYIFLYKKYLVECYYENADQMLIFEDFQ